jgi:hypothetical protein
MVQPGAPGGLANRLRLPELRYAGYSPLNRSASS